MTSSSISPRDGYNLYSLTINEHTGTHLDAPLHFSADGASVDELPVGDLVIPLCIVDIRARAAEDRDTQVTPDDLTAWIAANGPIPDRACVAMNSGWAAKVGTPISAAPIRRARAGCISRAFISRRRGCCWRKRPPPRWRSTRCRSTMGRRADFATHYAWLPAGRYGIECVAGLDALPATGATLVVGAPKVRGGTGGPARLFRDGLMATVPLLTDEAACAEARAVFDDIRAVRGTDFVNNFWRALAHDPALLKATWERLKVVMAPGALDPKTKEMLYLAVSVANGCTYCIHSHTAAARGRGMTDTELGEVLAVVGMAAQTNALVNALQVPVDGRFDTG
jgi:AhpD family alkylhydroperoxidase